MRVHPAYARRHAVARHRAAYGTARPLTPEERAELEAMKSGGTPAPADMKVDENLRKAAMVGIAGIAAVAALAGVGVFVINPWIVKAFKPEWSYGRRLAASFGVTFIAGTLTSIARGLGGVQDTPTAPATK